MNLSTMEIKIGKAQDVHQDSFVEEPEAATSLWIPIVSQLYPFRERCILSQLTRRKICCQRKYLTVISLHEKYVQLIAILSFHGAEYGQDCKIHLSSTVFCQRDEMQKTYPRYVDECQKYLGHRKLLIISLSIPLELKFKLRHLISKVFVWSSF